MKSLFYFTFGVMVMLFTFVALFNAYAVEYLDDYYVDLLYSNYFDYWKIINKTIINFINKEIRFIFFIKPPLQKIFNDITIINYLN